MSTVVVVWLVIGLISTAMVVAVLAGLVRHVLVLLRTVRRFGDEVAPIAQEIAAASERTPSRARSPRPDHAG